MEVEGVNLVIHRRVHVCRAQDSDRLEPSCGFDRQWLRNKVQYS